MKFREIITELSQKYSIQVLSEADSGSLLDLAFLDGKSRHFPETIVFFGYDDQLPDLLPQNLFLISEDPEEARHTLQAWVLARGDGKMNLALIRKARAGAFFNDVRELIEKHRRSGYYDAVADTMEKVRNIPALIDSAALSFGASLVLCDMEYRILAWSTAIPVTDSVWKENIARGFCDYGFIKEVRSLRVVQTRAGSGEPFEVNCSQSPYRKFACLIEIGGEPAGFILLIETEESYREVHPRMLSAVSRALSIGIPRYAPAWIRKRSPLQTLLYNLMIGARLSDFPEAIRYFPSFRDCRVLCFRKGRTQGGGREDQTDFGMADALEVQIPGSTVICFRGSFYMLLSDAQAADALEEASPLVSFAALHGLKVSTSPLFENLESFRGACLAAGQVLDRNRDEGSMILTFEKALPAILVDSLDGPLDKTFFIHPALKAVSDYDERNDSHLLKTLKTYLAHGESIKDTADTLFLHRNSVIYRLGKIEELGRVSLADPETRFVLRLGLAIRESLQEGREEED